MARESLIAAATFVPGDEREELLLGFAELAYERGYELVRLADLVTRSGASPATVLGYWSDEESCALDALRAGAEQGFAVVARAFISLPGDGPAAAHRSLAALLGYLASSPALTSLSVLAPPLLRGRAARHAGVLDVVPEFLVPGFTAIGRVPPRPEIVSQRSPAGSPRSFTATSSSHGCPSCPPRCRRSVTSASPASSAPPRRSASAACPSASRASGTRSRSLAATAPTGPRRRRPTRETTAHPGG